MVPRWGTCPLKGALLTDPAGLVPTTLSPLSPFARWALASRYKASGSATCQRKGETASHKPGLPLPALVRWGAGRAVSGEPRWFVVNPSGFPMRPEERRVISRPDGAVGFWGCAVPRNIVPRWGTCPLKGALLTDPGGWQQLYPSCPPFLPDTKHRDLRLARAREGRAWIVRDRSDRSEPTSPPLL